VNDPYRGPLFTAGGSSGSATTGDWVTDGTTFYLTDNNQSIIASVVVHLEQQLAVFTADPNPILSSPIGATTLQWNAPTATTVEIHVAAQPERFSPKAAVPAPPQLAIG